jgi:hypothetical protein
MHVGLTGAYREGLVLAVRRHSSGYRGRRRLCADLGRDDGKAGAVLSSPCPQHSRAPHAGPWSSSRYEHELSTRDTSLTFDWRAFLCVRGGLLALTREPMPLCVCVPIHVH